jgi:hypothetical protein
MSAHKGSSACHISVDPSTADVLRLEAKKVLMFGHEPFEDFLDYIPAKQLALDLLTDIGADKHTNALVMVDIHTNRHSVEALNCVFDAYTDTITA